jgi:transposase
MKHYPAEFKADAVALYQSRPGATIRQVAADLGVNPETLRNWVRAAGANRPRGRRAEAPAEPPTPLEAENAALRKKVRELEEEREILRQYFPKGTDLARWSAEEIEAVAHALNTRPRKTLGWRTPAEAFNEQLLLLQQAGVATTG